jgi:hypothetical protein
MSSLTGTDYHNLVVTSEGGGSQRYRQVVSELMGAKRSRYVSAAHVGGARARRAGRAWW